MADTASAAVTPSPRPAAGPEAAPPSLERILSVQTAFQKSAALKGAIDLDLFTAIGEGNETAAALARRCGASERGVRILCDYLVVEGLLEKRGDRYALPPDVALFLDRRSPGYLGTTVRFLNAPPLMEAFRDVAALVRKGGTLMPGEGSVEPENPMWVDFARAMAPMMSLPAELIAGQVVGTQPVRRVLDIAAGHGLFGIAIAKRHPETRVTALDWPQVLEVARENAEAAGVADRMRLLSGDAFTVPFGTGYDLVLLTNFLHHFDRPRCVALLRRVAASLADGGRAVALEFVPDESRVAPPVPARFSLMMLGTTAAGDAYTFRELEGMFHDAGFAEVELRAIPPVLQQVVVATKRTS